MPPDWEEDPERWVLERSRFLSSRKIGLRDKVAEAVAWSELGFSKHGIARQMDVGESTASKYVDTADSIYPGICSRTVVDIGGRTDAGIEGLPGARRQCPVCLKDRLCGPKTVKQVFRTSGWGATSMLEDADRVCSFCHAVRIDGQWQRMETVDSRAWKLSQASSSKNVNDYKVILTQGIDTGKEKPTADDAEDW